MHSKLIYASIWQHFCIFAFIMTTLFCAIKEREAIKWCLKAGLSLIVLFVKKNFFKSIIRILGIKPLNLRKLREAIIWYQCSILKLSTIKYSRYFLPSLNYEHNPPPQLIIPHPDATLIYDLRLECTTKQTWFTITMFVKLN